MDLTNDLVETSCTNSPPDSHTTSIIAILENKRKRTQPGVPERTLYSRQKLLQERQRGFLLASGDDFSGTPIVM